MAAAAEKMAALTETSCQSHPHITRKCNVCVGNQRSVSKIVERNMGWWSKSPSVSQSSVVFFALDLEQTDGMAVPSIITELA